jgi:hypothetical protein
MSRNENRRAVLALAAALAFGTQALAQGLRHGIRDADTVVVARCIGVQPLGDALFLHRLEVERTLKGEPLARCSVVEAKDVADRPRPVPAAMRLYCLQVDRRDLPARDAPYFRMTGHAGDNPNVDPSSGADPLLRLAELLVGRERGDAPAAVCDQLVEMALRDSAPARTEAVEVLRETESLRSRLSALQRQSLLARAVGETEDITHKLALASLCAELGMDGVVDALCLSIEEVDDPRFSETLGRIARHLHGDGALDAIRPHLVRARTPAARDRLLLALGASGTTRALEALLRYRRVNGPGPAVDAALRAHGTKRAFEAVGPK